MDSTCPDCGSQMEFAESAFVPSSRPRPVSQRDDGKLTLLQGCPNPDCPGKQSDLAPPTDEG